MSQLITPLALELAALSAPLTVRAKQGDEGSRFLRISLVENGEAFSIPPEAAVRLSIHKPDGKQILLDGTHTANEALFELSAQALRCSGVAKAEVRVEQNSTLLSSGVFSLEIHPTAFRADKLESEDDYQSITKLFDQAGTLYRHTEDTAHHVSDADRVLLKEIPFIAENAAPLLHTHTPAQVTGLAQQLTAFTDALTQQSAALNERVTHNELQDTLKEVGAMLSVRAFGAKGDGKTDDTAAFRTAVARAAALGRILYLDSGTYRICETLVLTQPLMILGAGPENTVLRFDGKTPVPETPYDSVHYEESHAAISVRSDNVTLWNFELCGGTKQAPSPYNGIIFHYPIQKDSGGVLRNLYASAERCNLQQLNVRCFKNGLFVYAGWNRYILTSHFIDCANCGIEYRPLERATVGAWSASGDIIQSCQFVGSAVGFQADGCFETTVQNCVFEYNGRPLWAADCRDLFFVNCWNEANTGKAYVAGSARFSGGYNLLPDSVEHVNTGGKNVVEFDTDTERIIKQGDQTVFYQTGGVITTGVALGSQRINEVENPQFGTIADPNLNGWSYDVARLVSVDTAQKRNGFSSAVLDCGAENGWTGSPGYGMLTAAIPVDPQKHYHFQTALLTNDINALSQGAFLLFRILKNGETIAWAGETAVTPIANSSWEEHTLAFCAADFGCRDATHVQVKIFIKQFGKLWINSPFFGEDSVTSDTAGLRIGADSTLLEAVDYTGAPIGQLAKKSYVDQQIEALKKLITG